MRLGAHARRHRRHRHWLVGVPSQFLLSQRDAFLPSFPVTMIPRLGSLPSASSSIATSRSSESCHVCLLPDPNEPDLVTSLYPPSTDTNESTTPYSKSSDDAGRAHCDEPIASTTRSDAVCSHLGKLDTATMGAALSEEGARGARVRSGRIPRSILRSIARATTAPLGDRQICDEVGSCGGIAVVSPISLKRGLPSKPILFLIVRRGRWIRI